MLPPGEYKRGVELSDSAFCQITLVLTIITTSTGWTAKERTTVDIGIVERDTVTLDTLRLNARRPPFVCTHFLQRTNEHAVNSTNCNISLHHRVLEETGKLSSAFRWMSNNAFSPVIGPMLRFP